jgi:hypothetical protein
MEVILIIQSNSIENIMLWNLRNIQIQWNLSNPTHQGIREMCQIVQDVGILRFYLKQKNMIELYVVLQVVYAVMTRYHKVVIF